MSDDKSEQAQKIISKFTKGVAVVGLLPLPLVDALVISGTQLKMLQKLSQLYDVKFTEVRGKAVLSVLLGSVVPLSLRSSLFSLCKAHPVVAAVVGSLSMSAFSSASTYAIGKVFILHFESGGTLLDFDAEKMREYYQQQLIEVKNEPVANYIGIKP